MISDQNRARLTAVCGWLMLGLGAAALFLPEIAATNGALVVGELLIACGILEIIAAGARRAARLPSALAGAASIAAGIMFLLRDETQFLPNLTVVTVWLLLRAVCLALATLEAGRSSIRRWTGVAAATDLALAGVLILGLPVASMIVALFGATSDLIASFSWILAFSFVAAGMMLLQIAACEREGAA